MREVVVGKRELVNRRTKSLAEKRGSSNDVNKAAANSKKRKEPLAGASTVSGKLDYERPGEGGPETLVGRGLSQEENPSYYPVFNEGETKIR